MVRVAVLVLFDYSASGGDVPRPDGNQSSTTFSDGCLGSHNDEERSEMRYVMRIARPRESLKF